MTLQTLMTIMQKLLDQCQIIQTHLRYNIPAMPASERINQGCQYALALMVEAGELVQTLPWKPWKKGDVENARTLDELADVLIFAGDLCLCLGFTAEDIEKAVLAKTNKILLRQNYGKGENE